METGMSVFMPVMTIDDAANRRNAIVDFVKRAMVKDVDFGVIPGTDKPTLLKPGAEKLCTLFGLSPRFYLIESEKDWTGKAHSGEPFFYFHYKCELSHTNMLIAEGEGSCNSWEKKYRWRNQDRICPNCGKPNIRKSKQGDGWYCWTKTGGCGNSFVANDQAIVSQSAGQIANPDIADQVNTLQKMAQKRALIAATLIAVNASEFFNQDIEDMVIDGTFVDVKSQNQSNGESPKSDKPASGVRQSWAASSALLTRISEHVGYYGKVRPHIINALQKLGAEGNIKLEMTDDEVFAIVNQHAKAEADQKAAAVQR